MEKRIYTNSAPDQFMRANDFDLFYLNSTDDLHIENLSHDYFEFYFFLDGRITIYIEQVQYTLAPGSVVFLPPMVPHGLISIDSGTPCQRFILCISKSYFEELLARSGDYGFILRHATRSRQYLYQLQYATFSRLQNKIITLLEEQHSDRFGREELLSISIRDLMLTLNRAVYEMYTPAPSTGTHHALTHQIISYTDLHLRENITLDDLAETFFVSKYHISHIFKAQVGISFHRYLTKKRLELAHNAILRNEDISNRYMEYGFNDYSGLFRAFKKEYGLSPKEYQKQLTAGRPL